MLLGTQTNSLVNHLLARSTVGQPDASVGMGATVLSWSDRHPATVTDVSEWRNGTLLTVQEDQAIRTDSLGRSDSQRYEYQRCMSGRVWRFWFDERVAVWREVYEAEGGKLKLHRRGGGRGFALGVRERYHDYNF